MPKEEETCKKKIDYLRERVCLAILENIIIAAEATFGEVYLAGLFILCGYLREFACSKLEVESRK